MSLSLSQLLTGVEGFEWDEANIQKNWIKHKVTRKEMEEVFFDTRVAVRNDPGHSLVEDRYAVLGRTDRQRLLYVVYTVRNKKIRVISARDVSKQKEVEIYEKAA